MSLDLTKPIQTREGGEARYIGKVEHPTYPLVFAIRSTTHPNKEQVVTRDTLGKVYGIRECQLDIINVPEPKVSKFAAVYVNGCGAYRSTMSSAWDSCLRGAQGILEVVLEGGKVVEVIYHGLAD